MSRKLSVKLLSMATSTQGPLANTRSVQAQWRGYWKGQKPDASLHLGETGARPNED